MKLNSRFILMPKYPNLKQCTKGIFIHNHTWTVHKYRVIMRVILSILTEICLPLGIQLVWEYLYIMYLFHYLVQTDKTLKWLQSAVNTFWKLLRDPNGSFPHYGKITKHWAPSKLPIFYHYASEAKEKGALTTVFTDRTEIWHKILKAAYARSNQNDNCSKFIVRYVFHIITFRVKVSNLDLESSIISQATPEQVINDANRPGLISDVSATTSSSNRGVELDVEDNNDEELKLEAVPSDGNLTMQTSKGMTWC